MCQRCSKWALLSTNKVFVAAGALLASAIREGGATAAALNNLAIVYKTFEKEFQKRTLKYRYSRCVKDLFKH
jgi:hypothetical protein